MTGRGATASNAPVGVLDSGVGGLTVLRDLLRELPDERFIYFGDTGNCPYGTRPDEEIRALSLAVARFLIEREVKLVVVACNTASVASRTVLRETFPEIPFVVVVPAVKPAAERTRTGQVGIAATEASARGGYLKHLIEEHAQGVQVTAVGCPELVTLAEAGIFDGQIAERAVREALAPLLASGIDELVLGCTHFPALRTTIERVAGPGVEVIDSGTAVARQARRVLTERQLLAPPGGVSLAEPRLLRSDDEFWCSGEVAPFARTASAILGEQVQPRQALAPATL